MVPFLWMGFKCLKATEPLQGSWSHPVVLNPGPLDWDSSAIITRQKKTSILICIYSTKNHFLAYQMESTIVDVKGFDFTGPP